MAGKKKAATVYEVYDDDGKVLGYTDALAEGERGNVVSARADDAPFENRTPKGTPRPKGGRQLKKTIDDVVGMTDPTG